TGIDDARLPVEPHPPQPAPFLFVVIDEHRYRRVGGDVSQSLEVPGPFRFCVDREIQVVTLEGEADRDEVWDSAVTDGRQVGDASRGRAPAHLVLVHA